MRTFAGALTIVLLTVQPILAAEQHLPSTTFRGNLPDCSALGSGREPNIIPADKRNDASLRVYCDGVDALESPPTFVIDFLRRNATSFDRVDGMFYSIGRSAFNEALCNALSPSLKHLRVIAGGQGWSNEMSKCVPNQGYVRLIPVTTIDEFKSFHPKFLAMSAAERGWLYITSGNPTSRAGNVLDFNLIIEISAKAPLFLWHTCVAQIFEAYLGGVGEEPLADRYKFCQLAGEPADPETIRPLLMPFDNVQYLVNFAYWAGRADSIKIVSQGYNSDDLMNVLRQAAANGTKIKYLRDDDLLLTGDPRHLELDNEYGEYFAWDEPLCGPGTAARFLLTKPQYNFLHAKFVIFEGTFGTVVMFGSGNATYSAIYQNIENNYVSRREEINSLFIDYFERLWSKYSVDYQQWSELAAAIGPYRNLKRISFDECHQ
ncbi:hypothetical protein J2855_002161 [Agrobacterium tumefaciens]|uniref:phospholipase D family protein n=1 Tax=Agrobacterium tumefaciens TaxID=358 RepID=UPI001AE24418|nr:phospholipase D family protein [Agrobacterium tumefaciens]MBP2508526.1 hypothetical protein [Agrobacterium tumefaciens]MBP2517678.1 hypothetical protein [Agrobacterium tumefaciens]MBP2576312.1 hypothetical protein [Agrobacterium tumefaciens]MBP2594668.1 hypothetical protein [Agrobacterium tumefaciens]